MNRRTMYFSQTFDVFEMHFYQAQNVFETKTNEQAHNVFLSDTKCV